MIDALHSLRIATIFSGLLGLIAWWLQLPLVTADPLDDWTAFQAAARASLRFGPLPSVSRRFES